MHQSVQCPFPADGSKPQRIASWHKTEKISNRSKTHGTRRLSAEWKLYACWECYVTVRRAAKVSQAYARIGVWSRTELAHGTKLHPPSVSKSDSGQACVCESGWAVIHRGRRPSCLMKVQNRSYSNSFIFLLLYSSFRISPSLKARAQTIPPACCHLGALNGSCFWSGNHMPGSEAFPLGCLTKSWKCEGKYIYVFSKRVQKKEKKKESAFICNTMSHYVPKNICS